MSLMTLRSQEMKEQNMRNRNSQKNKKVFNFLPTDEKLLKTKTPIDYSDFNKFIGRIKDTKTKKSKLDLMLEFIKQEAEEINETIK